MINVELENKEYKLPIPASEYFEFKQKPHPISLEKLTDYVSYNNETIKKRARFLTKKIYSKEKRAQRLLDFVHSHLYDASIKKVAKQVKYPIETLVERCGDCEDLAILGAALMKSIRIDVALIYFPPLKDKKLWGHIALGVNGNFYGKYYEKDGKKYFYAETTGTDWNFERASWKIGQIPKQFENRKAKLFVVK